MRNLKKILSVAITAVIFTGSLSAFKYFHRNGKDTRGQLIETYINALKNGDLQKISELAPESYSTESIKNDSLQRVRKFEGLNFDRLNINLEKVKPSYNEVLIKGFRSNKKVYEESLTLHYKPSSFLGTNNLSVWGGHWYLGIGKLQKQKKW